jgi:phosphoribosylaminoimidazole-succinocarboxamide synthase
MLTPDSRYWPADEYQVGTSPPSYDADRARLSGNAELDSARPARNRRPK